METKFKFGDKVICRRQEKTESEIGIIAEIDEENALVEDKAGNQWEETTYTVMCRNEDEKIVFEEFLESDLKASL